MSERKAVVAEFESELDAEFAVGRLEAAGIKAVVIKDDAGGMFPSLQQTEGVKVLVDEGDLERAAAVLRNAV